MNLPLDTPLFSCVIAEWDIIQKIATIKSKNKWKQEGEWRIIVHRQQDDQRCFFAPNGLQRLALNIPIPFLKRISLFYNNENKDEMNEVFAYLID